MEHRVDVVLVGAGIMSATLGALIKELDPSLSILVLERLNGSCQESSSAWNNAGTGHQALCELNYTPEFEDGSVEVKKALQIDEAFEISKQFWAYHVQKGTLKDPRTFIHPVPHMSFVMGKDVDYLRRRYEALTGHVLFEGMEYSQEVQTIADWVPLLMEGRSTDELVAATKSSLGTDVDFGSLGEQLFQSLASRDGFSLRLSTEVVDLERSGDSFWKLKIRELGSGEIYTLQSRFVFLGAGGASLRLLQKSKILEGSGYGGVPVSGQWLVCKNPEVIKRHAAKVYGKAALGAPPMSVPHLDTRWIGGKQELLFGPFAGFSTKFLKNGSPLDMPLSIRGGNFLPMTQAGIDNIPLTLYLVRQVMLSFEDRIEVLQGYMPSADSKDWELCIAGQRVQIVKKDPKSGRGVLQFGTEVVASGDGTIAALLGASPGASTAVVIMLELLERCFGKRMASQEWQKKLHEMIPSLGHQMDREPVLTHEMRDYTARVLKILAC